MMWRGKPSIWISWWSRSRVVPGNRRDDGGVLAGQGIEQAGFANIGAGGTAGEHRSMASGTRCTPAASTATASQRRPRRRPPLQQPGHQRCARQGHARGHHDVGQAEPVIAQQARTRDAVEMLRQTQRPADTGENQRGSHERLQRGERTLLRRRRTFRFWTFTTNIARRRERTIARAVPQQVGQYQPENAHRQETDHKQRGHVGRRKVVIQPVVDVDLVRAPPRRSAARRGSA